MVWLGGIMIREIDLFMLKNQQLHKNGTNYYIIDIMQYHDVKKDKSELVVYLAEYLMQKAAPTIDQATHFITIDYMITMTSPQSILNTIYQRPVYPIKLLSKRNTEMFKAIYGE